MRHPESNTNTANQWFYTLWFSWLSAKTKNGIAWLFPNQPDYPANEVGELMQRTMAQKSWFDTVSSTWAEQSIWVQSLAVVRVILCFGLMGWLIAAPVILPLTRFFVCTVTHVLLVAHEHQRLNSARLLSTEALSLTDDLELSKQLLDAATNNVSSVVSELNKQNQCIIEQAQALDEHARLISQHKNALIICVEEVQDSTKFLLAAQKKPIRSWSRLQVI